MKKVFYYFWLPVFTVFTPLLSFAQTPNWSEDIAPLLYAHCTQCHRPGEIAPMSLLTFEDAYNYMYSIQSNVSSKLMPPWPADPSYVHFVDENYLTDDQITIINDWVNNGAPSGDISLAPEPPVYTDGSILGTPDTTWHFAQKFYYAGGLTDTFVCFVIPSGLTKDKIIKGVEFRPGNEKICHHVGIYGDTSGAARILDDSFPGYGYPLFGGLGFGGATKLGAWFPGNRTRFLPDGVGKFLPANSDIVIKVHYSGGVDPATDSSSVNVFYDKVDTSSIRFYDEWAVSRNNITNGPFIIPANTIQTFYADRKVGDTLGDASMIDVTGHMHLLGTYMKAFAVTNTFDTIPLLLINKWNFHWQFIYRFTHYIKLPVKSHVYLTATYDNTINNPQNPFNPPQDVYFGEEMTDEMMHLYMGMVPYEAGDENISLDGDTSIATYVPDPTQGNIVKTLQFYEMYPNPAQTNMTYYFYLPQAEEVRGEVYDISGHLVQVSFDKKQQLPGFYYLQANLSQLSNGIYTCVIKAGDEVKSKQIVIQK